MRYVGTVSTGPLALSDYFDLEDASDVHNQPLWHYTDAAGLSGILTSGKIRATHVAHLNDPTEIVHGEELASLLAKNLAWPERSEHVTAGPRAPKARHARPTRSLFPAFTCIRGRSPTRHMSS
jgi:hypothetical protein